jgi:hypothetical protein
VLAVYGEHDGIMSREDHELITRLVNRNRSGAAGLVVIPKKGNFYLV